MIVLTYHQLYQKGLNDLKNAGCANAQRDCDLLLQAATGFDKGQLIARFHDSCTLGHQAEFEAFIQRRMMREPVARILGKRSFFGLDLYLGDHSLEPREDTEALVEATLGKINDKNAPLCFLDLGTGTGAIALALLSVLPRAHAFAVDLSPETLDIAFLNARHHGFDERFTALQGYWFDALKARGLYEKKFDFIVSNPPYIASAIVDELAPEVLNHDPRLALDGGGDGLDAYRLLLEQAPEFLKGDGFFALEMGYDQREAVTAIAHCFDWVLEQNIYDLAQRDRGLLFTL